MKFFESKTISADSKLIEMEERLIQIDDAIRQATADGQAHALRQRQAAETVAVLTELARTGKLADPTRLTTALQIQASLTDDSAVRLQNLLADKSMLETGIREWRKTVAKECYQSAVVAYAEACAPLLALAQAIRDCALAADVHITPGNSPGLVGVHIQIGGALIDIRK